MKATCENCNQVTRIKYKVAQYSDGIQETYFKCFQCNKKYTCFVTDKKVRDLQEEIGLSTGGANVGKREQLQDEVNERMDILKCELITNDPN